MISFCIDLRFVVRLGDRDEACRMAATDAVSPIPSNSFSRMSLVSPYKTKIYIQFKKPGFKRIRLNLYRQDYVTTASDAETRANNSTKSSDDSNKLWQKYTFDSQQNADKNTAILQSTNSCWFLYILAVVDVNLNCVVIVILEAYKQKNNSDRI